MLATGDQVQAQSLEEEGTPTRTLQGTLEILDVPSWDYYPAFTAFFVDGQEADETTITVATKPALAASVELQNDCHAPDTGRFCETDDGTGTSDSILPLDNAVRVTKALPKGWTQNRKEWQGGLSSEENAALGRYRGSDAWVDISAVARGEDIMPSDEFLAEYAQERGYPVEDLRATYQNNKDSITEAVTHLKTALGRAPVSSPYLAYRGVRLPKEWDQTQTDAYIAEAYTPGAVIGMSKGGFQSASGKIDAPVYISKANTDRHQGVMFEIAARTMPIASYNDGRSTYGPMGYPAEHEVLFHPDTRFRVVRVVKDVPVMSHGDTTVVTMVQVEEL